MIFKDMCFLPFIAPLRHKIVWTFFSVLLIWSQFMCRTVNKNQFSCSLPVQEMLVCALSVKSGVFPWNSKAEVAQLYRHTADKRPVNRGGCNSKGEGLDWDISIAGVTNRLDPESYLLGLESKRATSLLHCTKTQNVLSHALLSMILNNVKTPIMPKSSQ